MKNLIHNNLVSWSDLEENIKEDKMDEIDFFPDFSLI